MQLVRRFSYFEMTITEYKIGKIERSVFVVDDFVPAEAHKQIFEFFVMLPWFLGDTDRADTRHVRHLAHPFSPDAWTTNAVLHSLSSFGQRFLREQAHIDGLEIARIYANFNLAGDLQFAHEDGVGWTVLMFINDQWHEDWAGEFIAYDDDISQPALSIPPRPGRVLIFDGQIRHRGGVPSKLCFDPRITLAVKLRPARKPPAAASP